MECLGGQQKGHEIHIAPRDPIGRHIQHEKVDNGSCGYAMLAGKLVNILETTRVTY